MVTDFGSPARRALAGLKPQLSVHGFATEWSDAGLRVMVHPGKGNESDQPADVLADGLITCARRPDDDGRWWWHLDGVPLAEIDHPYEAITALKGAFATQLNAAGA
ncbi:hypothetical protein [Actinomadura oligospora]|uniref:hypothetical protein n=1 Tax=Actinomadura oligospora TaxID=111804 RepID=UPI00047B6C96|nr:hypothetical protein [Actinomadura oligospora]